MSLSTGGGPGNPKKKELFSVVIFWSPDPLHVDWLGFSQLATGLNQQSSDTFFCFNKGY
jgi:hypothetical protein